MTAAEKQIITDWARELMVVRSGNHTELFRLNLQKQKLYENFCCAYPRLLRALARRDHTLRPSVHAQNITIFHRNMESALWLQTEQGFEEGQVADEEERQRLLKRLKDNWARGVLPTVSMASFDAATWLTVYRSEEWFWDTIRSEGLRFRCEHTPYECAVCKKIVSTLSKFMCTCGVCCVFVVLLRCVRFAIAHTLQGPHAERLQVVERILGQGRFASPEDKTSLESEQADLMKRTNNDRLHKEQVEHQRKYNIDDVHEWLKGSRRRV